jgi:hypothetical protein
MARDEQAVRRFVERSAMVLEDCGFPRMPGRVLMTLMSAEEDGLTAAELAERLEVSPGAISGAVRYLATAGLVVREPVAGSRRDRYRLPADTWYEASVVQMGWLKVLGDLSGEGVEALGGPTTSAGRRVAEMRDFFLFVRSELPALLDRWEARRGKGAPR